MSTINQKEIINDTIEDNYSWDDFLNDLKYNPYSPFSCIPCSTTSNC